jgi:hypothetical protein
LLKEAASMENIETRLQKVPDNLNIYELNTPRTMPDAIFLAFKKPSRKALFWFDPKEQILDISESARTHFDMDNFSIIKTPKGWVRGAVFEKDKSLFMLIHKEDFTRGEMFTGKILKKIYQEVSEKHGYKVHDIFSEEGYSLVTF